MQLTLVFTAYQQAADITHELTNKPYSQISHLLQQLQSLLASLLDLHGQMILKAIMPCT